MVCSRIIFVGQTGTCREAMAAGIMQEISLKHPIEILARGLVVQFSGPMNQKAEAVMIGNGINMEGYNSEQLSEEDITEGTLVLTMESVQRVRVLEQYENANEENVHVLTEYVGDELEIIDPYGGTLTAYGLCYESLRTSIWKLVKMINESL